MSKDSNKLFNFDRFTVISAVATIALVFELQRLLHWYFTEKEFDKATNVKFLHFYEVLIPLAMLVSAIAICVGIALAIIKLKYGTVLEEFYRATAIRILLSSNIFMLVTFTIITEVKRNSKYDIRLVYLTIIAVLIALMLYCNACTIFCINDYDDDSSYGYIKDCLVSLKKWCEDDKNKAVYSEQAKKFNDMANRIEKLGSEYSREIDKKHGDTIRDVTDNLYTLMAVDKIKFIEKSNALLELLDSMIKESEKLKIETANKDIDEALSLIETDINAKKA